MTNISPPALVQPALRSALSASQSAQSAAAQSAAGQSAAGQSTAARSAAGHAAPAMSRSTQPPDLAKIAKSAQDFEAMALNELLKPMFDTVDTAHGGFGGGDGEEAWKPMMVQEMAKHIAAAGGLGLAKPVYDAMLRMQEQKSK